MSHIAFQGVAKRYRRRTAVQELNFEVSHGECFGLVGPNGAGKSTTLKLLLGLVKPSQGRVTIDDQDPWRHPDARQSIGYVPERSALYPEMTCAATVAYSARFYGLEPSHEEIRERLASVGLRDVEKVRVRALSKGMGQRLSLACALIHEPTTLILDEPFSGLDPQGRRDWGRMLRTLIDEDRTVVLSSHDLDAVEALADRVAVLREGQLVALDSLDALLGDHLDRVHVELDGDVETWMERIRALDGVDAVARNGSGLNVTLHQPDARSQLARQLVEAGGQLTDFHLKRPTLDDLFNKLTAEERPAENPVPHDREETRDA